MSSLFLDSVSLRAPGFNSQVHVLAALLQVFPCLLPLASCSKLLSIGALNWFSFHHRGLGGNEEGEMESKKTLELQFQLCLNFKT